MNISVNPKHRYDKLPVPKKDLTTLDIYHTLCDISQLNNKIHIRHINIKVELRDEFAQMLKCHNVRQITYLVNNQTQSYHVDDINDIPLHLAEDIHILWVNRRRSKWYRVGDTTSEHYVKDYRGDWVKASREVSSDLRLSNIGLPLLNTQVYKRGHQSCKDRVMYNAVYHELKRTMSVLIDDRNPYINCDILGDVVDNAIELESMGMDWAHKKGLNDKVRLT